MAKRFCSAEEASKLFNLPISTIYRKIREKKLPIAPHGKPYRIDLWAVEEKIKEEAS